MNILFIYPGPDISYPIQLGALSAFLKRYGHQTALLELVVQRRLNATHWADVRKAIEIFRPHLVGFTAYETSFDWIRELADYLKTQYNLPIIVGGYHATLVPQEAIRHNSIDIVCRGEGEYPLLELVTRMEREEDTTSTPNLWVKKDGQVYQNPIRPLIEDLDELPFPDREMLDYQRHLEMGGEGDRNVKLIASRGCPYDCTYCSNYYIKQLYPNKHKYLRMRSVDNVLQEIEGLANRYTFDSLGFHDDNLTLFPRWLEEFCEKYPHRFRFPFYCAARPETCSAKTLRMLKNAGCNLLLLGIESGDEQLRRSVLNRRMTNQSIIKSFQTARRLGIQTWSFNMVGLPYEGRLSLLRTIWLNFQIGPDFAMTSIFYPFKGTALGDLCYANNWVNLQRRSSVGSYAWDSVLNHPHLSRLEIRLAKYLNTLTALRGRGLLFKAIRGRIVNWLRHRMCRWAGPA
ncbi:MAG: B12-binding domain-containing radical SAM protein [Chloroflexi bacterium]|nr:B12-binding domain-containing radical SAM protein [Chloroflexota bacterium]